MAEKPDKQPNNGNLNNGRWKKGQSGNLKGRPKGQGSIEALYRDPTLFIALLPSQITLVFLCLEVLLHIIDTVLTDITKGHRTPP